MSFDYNKWKRDRNTQRIIDGICLDCDAKALPAANRCKYHHDRHKQLQKVSAQKKRDTVKKAKFLAQQLDLPI